MSSNHKPGNQNALHHTLMTLLLVLGSAAPAAIAFFLVASANNDGNPLDKIPDYDMLPSETLVIPLDRGEPTYTQFEYWGKVRLVIEGTGQAADMTYRDAFYVYTDTNGHPLETPPISPSGLEIDRRQAINALAMTADQLVYDPDHLYAVIYDVGSRARRIAFRVPVDPAEDQTGELNITVVQLK